MRFEGKITVTLNQQDAAIVAVLLAGEAARLSLDALRADGAAEVGGTINKDLLALADTYNKVGTALSFALMTEPENRGLQSTMSLVQSNALAGAATKAAGKVCTETEAD